VVATLIAATDARLTTIVDALADQPRDAWSWRLSAALGAWYERHPTITLVLLILNGAIPAIGGVMGVAIGIARADVEMVGQSVLILVEAAVTYLAWRIPLLVVGRMDDRPRS
jgi:hypothetical protein